MLIINRFVYVNHKSDSYIRLGVKGLIEMYGYKDTLNASCLHIP